MANTNNNMIPYTYRETRNGIEYISMPSELFKNRKIFLIGDIDRFSAVFLLQSFMILDGISDEPIELYINSTGGEVSSGFAVYQFVTKQMKAPVNTIAIGIAASMAAILYLAGTERTMYEGTTIMIHDPSSISAAFEKPEQLKERLDMLEDIKDMSCRIIAERTGHTYNEIAELMKKDTYFGADEALKFGIATEIIKKGGIYNE